MCLVQAKAVSIEGHPIAAINGLYTHDSTHEGWPVLKNGRDRYCYRYTPTDQWLISNEFSPDDDRCSANIVAEAGPLPVGAHTWQLGPSTLGTAGWEGRTLTVGLLISVSEVNAFERRIQEEKAKAVAAKAAKALAEVQKVLLSNI